LDEQMTKSDRWDRARASEIIAAHTSLDGAAMPILHALQDEFGYIHDEAVPLVAEALNLSRAEVHGIVTFYHDFRRDPAGRHVLKLCRAEACQSMDGARIASDFLTALGISWGDTTSDGCLTVEGVYCLGLCACAPSALFDGEPIGRLTPDTLAEVVQEARAS
jgi:formate dehydrogenase subunit gamma